MPALIDLTGQRFGALVVLRRADNSPDGKPRWLCVCDCGQTATAKTAVLSSGGTTSCGCGIHRSEARSADIAGMRFGKLTAMAKTGGRSTAGHLWLCQCDCGGTRTTTVSKLRSGHITTCGCRTEHGHARQKTSPTYRSWSTMIARCYYPSSPSFPYYGAKGITVCDRWRDFANFLTDMGERPGLDFSIDRFPDKSGNYEPGNCRWATRKEQSNNTTQNIIFMHKGKMQSIADIARDVGMPYDRLKTRLRRKGWPLERAISEPYSKGRRLDLSPWPD